MNDFLPLTNLTSHRSNFLNVSNWNCCSHDCDETGDLSRMWTNNQVPSDLRGFQIYWLPKCDFKTYAECGPWREQILSLQSRRDRRHEPVCVVLWVHASN